MQGHKQERLNEQYRDALSRLLGTVKDPRVTGLLSIVKVEITNDLSYAKVYVSSLEGEAALRDAIKGLESAKGYLRRELAARVKTRISPELRFVPDTSIAYGARINQILSGLNIPPAEEENEDDED